MSQSVLKGNAVLYYNKSTVLMCKMEFYGHLNQ